MGRPNFSELRFEAHPPWCLGLLQLSLRRERAPPAPVRAHETRVLSYHLGMANTPLRGFTVGTSPTADLGYPGEGGMTEEPRCPSTAGEELGTWSISAPWLKGKSTRWGAVLLCPPPTWGTPNKWSVHLSELQFAQLENGVTDVCLG